ncbi:hypothetical protein L228DRAFT_270122 [Xylona heveae TC161]|uniref:RRM domain-containing protein n=1 Tax=Xylona heveae (strain CBS 132557 / TC161) TaxID=1328760 RepID=A0A165FD89_XYLHT|nr:hypothetical protein L228DRAFT_270122 [Xylona heveae TC161]KZF20849.1 hypothetical protein L228DRAFT_270122 [Xylona heveae TC161]
MVTRSGRPDFKKVRFDGPTPESDNPQQMRAASPEDSAQGEITASGPRKRGGGQQGRREEEQTQDGGDDLLEDPAIRASPEVLAARKIHSRREARTGVVELPLPAPVSLPVDPEPAQSPAGGEGPEQPGPKTDVGRSQKAAKVVTEDLQEAVSQPQITPVVTQSVISTLPGVKLLEQTPAVFLPVKVSSSMRLGPLPERPERIEPQFYPVATSFQHWVHLDPRRFELLMGLFFQAGNDPNAIVGPGYRSGLFRIDLQRVDELEAGAYSGQVWSFSPDDSLMWHLIDWCQSNAGEFCVAIRRFADNALYHDKGFLHKTNPFTEILRRAGWIQYGDLIGGWAFRAIAAAKGMEPGPFKNRKLLHLRQFWPRLFSKLIGDESCRLTDWGISLDRPHLSPKRALDALDNNDNDDNVARGAKKVKMSVPNLARMQVHGVPEEERAFDSHGNRLPWGYLYADDSLNPRRPPEEKGPFGTPLRRNKSRSKTATPAKKEDPTVVEFGMIWAAQQQKDKEQKQASEQQSHPSTSFSTSTRTKSDVALSASAVDGTTTTSASAVTSIPSSIPAAARQPTEVILYGYFPDTQWRAIELYERISAGMICEDYPRLPPPERIKYKSSFQNIQAVLPRPLTREETKRARRYAGGESWIKVTFDSQEAADRACHFSPQSCGGCWVYAEPYRGVGPKEDVPLPVTEADAPDTLLGTPRPNRNNSRTNLSFGAAAQRSNSNSNSNISGLPRSFTTNTLSLPSQAPPPPSSSSTASSGTVTDFPVAPAVPAAATKLPRSTSQPVFSSGALATSTSNGEMSRRIPGVRRAVLLPAEQALLPQPSRTQRLMSQIPILGWFSGEVIGTAVPRLDNGEFDWVRASFWWRICYWIDLHFGTDLCGLRDDRNE